MDALTAVETEEEFARYGIDPDRGFLPATDPLERFDYDRFDADAADYLQELDRLAGTIPDLIADGALRYQLNSLGAPPDDLTTGMTEQELFRTYQASSFLASAYVHRTGDAADVDRIPAGVAVPLYDAATALDVPPIMSYDAYSLHNWTRRDPDGPIDVDNLDTMLNFVDLQDGRNDESWFMLIHVEIEQEAADALTAVPDAARAVERDDTDALYDALRRIDGSLDAVAGTMDRMAEENSPANYGDVQDAETEGYRPYIEGFDGVRYEGVDALDGPQSFRGETGAQSSIFPTLDRAFGVPHATSALTDHVDEMVDYMPRRHRDWLDAVDAGPDITDYVREAGDRELAAVHDDAMTRIIGFRILHRLFAYEYIEEPTGKQEGTGGTFYPDFLEDFIDECEQQLVLDDSREPHWSGYLQETFDGMPRAMQQLRG